MFKICTPYIVLNIFDFESFLFLFLKTGNEIKFYWTQMKFASNAIHYWDE